jgi:diguanylate cyclase (GGDEF)-like protein/PAS domain S-box-containing protein
MKNVRQRRVVRPPLTADRARAALLGEGEQDTFARLVRLATLALRAPIAVLAAVRDERLELVARSGAGEPWAIARDLLHVGTASPSMAVTGEAFVVESDPRTGETRHHSFCGAPVVVQGSVVAVLAVGDAQPRRWTPDDAALLRDLGASLLRDIELMFAEPPAAAQATWAGGLRPMPPIPTAQELADRARAAARPALEDLPRQAPRPLQSSQASHASQQAAPGSADAPRTSGGGEPVESREGVERTETGGAADAAGPGAATAGPDRGGPAVPLQDVPDGLVMLDAEWRFVMLNDRARELLAVGDEDVAGRSLWEACRQLVGTAFHQECMKAQRTACEIEEYCHSHGLWLEIRSYPADDGGVVLYVRDVTRRRAEHDALRGREARYRKLFEESGTALFVMSEDGMLHEVNEALVQLLGRAREDLQGSTLAELAADQEAVERLLEELGGEGSAAEVEVRFRRGSGDEVICLVSGARHEVGGGTYHGAMRDITQHKHVHDELLRTAGRDPLTGLANRTVFMHRLDDLLTRSKRRVGDRFAVLFVDLDNFKQVNDERGHLVGDQVLTDVARRLEACVREHDTVARIGGDEYGILLEQIQDGVSVTLVVDRIREALLQSFEEAGCPGGVTASIGIAMSASGYDRAEDLVRDADTAMYRAKASGRNDYVIFDSDMHDSALLQRQLESDLRGALAGDQLTVHYHPVIDLKGGALTGLEALVRWAHPRHGVLLPGEFMPLAERTGLSTEIGWWVLNEACAQMREWQDEYPEVTKPLTLSVNMSARQFLHPEMLARVDRILDETGLDPSVLRLDLTESVVMQNADQASLMLTALHERGIRICIDDFGTGYTSLQQLREFPISGLKIDGSFIRQLGSSGGGQEIVQSILALGRSMAIDAIAEGVETPEQLDQLRKLGTRFAQGFLFSLPLDRYAAGAMLEQTRA